MRLAAARGLSTERDATFEYLGFDEDLFRCRNCKTLWSVNHGTLEIVEEPVGNSFLQATPEAVEADDYNHSS